MREVIHRVLNETLAGKMYDEEMVSQWCKEISDGVKDRVKELGYDRYKVGAVGHLGWMGNVLDLKTCHRWSWKS